MSDINELIRLCNELNCKTILNCELKNYTTFKIGGQCRLLINISNLNSIIEIVNYLKINGMKFTIIGRGSNILVSDDGYNGVVLAIKNDFSDIEVVENKVICQAGAKLSAVCNIAQKNSLSGMENLFGIPGTIGGALYMNAGAYGTEMVDVVEYAECLDENQNIKKIYKEDMRLSYRKSVFMENKYIITKVALSLEKGDSTEIKTKMEQCMAKRVEKQPLEYPSAGSTFKRPEGSYASLLIEQCNLKGVSVGGAVVSEKHSGFVINKGNATFKDVISLCDNVKKVVEEKTGYVLEMEPIILG